MHEQMRRIIEEEENFDRMYSKVFGTEKKVLEDLDEYCGYNSDPFDPDERRTSYKLGMQAVIRYIHNRIDGQITEIIRKQNDG